MIFFKTQANFYAKLLYKINIFFNKTANTILIILKNSKIRGLYIYLLTYKFIVIINFL